MPARLAKVSSFYAKARFGGRAAPKELCLRCDGGVEFLREFSDMWVA